MRVYSGDNDYREATMTESLIFGAVIVYAAFAITVTSVGAGIPSRVAKVWKKCLRIKRESFRCSAR